MKSAEATKFHRKSGGEPGPVVSVSARKTRTALAQDGPISGTQWRAEQVFDADRQFANANSSGMMDSVCDGGAMPARPISPTPRAPSGLSSMSG